MKKLILSLVAIVTITFISFGQVPDGFKYQAVIRDAGNIILNNQSVGIRMTIQQGSIGGTTVYQETFAPTTNAYGLVNLEIGSGTVLSGNFTTIDWANGPYFIETAVDVTGGTSYAVMGTSQLMSVPYALHANTAENVINDQIDDADADPANELQDWSNLPGIPVNIDIDATDDFSGDYNDLTNQPTIPTLPTNVSAFTNDAGYVTTSNDADADPTNELQDWSNLPGIPVNIDIDATDDFSGDYNDLTNQPTIPTLPTNVSAFSNDAGYVTTSNDADSDPNNEIQTINRTGTTVTLSNGGGSFQDSIGVYTAGTGIDITNNIVSVSNEHYLGELYNGGIIFHLYVGSDNLQHGLIVSLTESATIQYQNPTTFDGAISTWNGLANTNLITNSPAVSFVNSLGTDWYIPSIDEMILLSTNRMHVNKALFTGGYTLLGETISFPGYWTSTEDVNNNARAISYNWNSCSFSSIWKTGTQVVRGVKAF